MYATPGLRSEVGRQGARRGAQLSSTAARQRGSSAARVTAHGRLLVVVVGAEEVPVRAVLLALLVLDHLDVLAQLVGQPRQVVRAVLEPQDHARRAAPHERLRRCAHVLVQAVGGVHVREGGGDEALARVADDVRALLVRQEAGELEGERAERDGRDWDRAPRLLARRGVDERHLDVGDVADLPAGPDELPTLVHARQVARAQLRASVRDVLADGREELPGVRRVRVHGVDDRGVVLAVVGG